MNIFYHSQWLWRLYKHFGSLKKVSDFVNLFSTTIRPYINRYEKYLSSTRDILIYWNESKYDSFTANELAEMSIYTNEAYWKLFFGNDLSLRNHDLYNVKGLLGRGLSC